MKTVMASMGSLGLALFAVTGCVSQSRYDRLATEYSSELQARRQLEDELGRHQGQLGDLNAQLREKDEAYSSLSASAQNDKSRIAELQKALDEAQKSFPVDDGSDGVEVFRTDSGFGYRIADALLFDPGSSDLRESGKKALVTIAREITEHHGGSLTASIVNGRIVFVMRLPAADQVPQSMGASGRSPRSS